MKNEVGKGERLSNTIDTECIAWLTIVTNVRLEAVDRCVYLRSSAFLYGEYYPSHAVRDARFVSSMTRL
jgi:hypothetical protein